PRRGPGGVPRHRGAHRARWRPLSPSWRVALFRPQRRERATLRVPRMEVRRDGPVRRHAQRAAREQLQRQDQAHVVSMRRAGRCGVDVHGSARAQTAHAEPRVDAPTRGASVGLKDVRALQLAPGPRGRDRHVPLLVPHSRAHNVAIDKSELRARARNPRLEVLDTDYGFTYAGIRHLADEGKNYVRVYQFVLPFHQMRAEGQGIRPDPQIDGHMWIPIDDEHTWVFNWAYRRDCGPIPEERWLDQEHRMGRGPEDLLPGFRLKQNIENDYLIDRALQRSGENYSGIPGVNTQDYAVQEGMGPIYDRTQEHLGTSDLAIIAARRMLLQSIRDLQAGREPAAPFADPSHVRPAEMVLP